MHRQTNGYFSAPGYWAENAPPNMMWGRLYPRIMLPTGRHLQCFFMGGGRESSEEARRAGFPAPRVILSPKKADRVMLPLFSTAAMKGHEERR